MENKITKNLDLIVEKIPLDLEAGPFLTGSTLTWMIEKNIRNTSWIPNDLDIVCKNQDQFNMVQDTLNSLGTLIVKTNWLGSNSTDWSIDGIITQAHVHPVTAEQRINFTDFSINALVYDGKRFLQDKNAEVDIRGKKLRWNPQSPILDISMLLKRYTKYLRRGYIDKNSNALKTIIKRHKELESVKAKFSNGPVVNRPMKKSSGRGR